MNKARICCSNAKAAYDPLLKMQYGPKIPRLSLGPKDGIALTAEEDAKVASLWAYKSDHLPMGGNLPFSRFRNGTQTSIAVGTWNKLNSAYMHHMTRAAWQDAYYMQQEKEVSVKYSGLSKREEECLDKVKMLMFGANKPLDVLCIQECSTKMFSALKQELERLGVQVFKSDGASLPGNKDINNHVVTVIKTWSGFQITNVFSKPLWQRKYVPAESKTPENPQGVQRFGPDEWRPVLFVQAKSTSLTGKEEKFVVGNVHISCAGGSDEYKKNRCEELFSGLEKIVPSDATVVLAGDYNTSDSVLRATGLSEYTDLVEEHGHVDAKEPEILKIDRVLIKTKEEKMLSYCGPIPLEELDSQAFEVYEKALAPIISQKR